jgi:hypothetical protein
MKHIRDILAFARDLGIVDARIEGEPVYHSHRPFPGHNTSRCEDPSSPLKRGYVTALEPPRTREELTRRIGRVLVQHIRGSGEAHLQMKLDEIHYLTEMLVDRLSDPRWPDTRTVAEILQGERGFEQLKAYLWNNSGLGFKL